MADNSNKPDARDSVIYANDLYSVGPHRKLVSGNSLVAVLKDKDLENKYPTFLSLMEEGNGIKNLKSMFNAIARGAKKNGADNQIFWLINVTDNRKTDKNMTHSQGSYPHAHIIHGPLPEDYKYGYVLTEKTYTPSPRADFKKNIQEFMHGHDFAAPTARGTYDIYNIPEETAESPGHIHISSPDFLGFFDFVARAEDTDYDILRSALTGILGDAEGQGGARLICDDFNSPGIFTLRIQSGDQKHKWFERPQPAL